GQVVGGDPAFLERRNQNPRQPRIPGPLHRGTAIRWWFGHRHDLNDGPSAAGQDASQIPNRRKYLIVPVGALGIVGTLFEFDDVLVLAENILRKPGDEGPDHVNDARNPRLLHG